MNRRRILSLFICFIFLLVIMPERRGLTLLAEKLENGRYSAYVTSLSDVPTGYEYILVASGGILTCGLDRMSGIESCTYKLLGESLSFYGNDEEFYDIIQFYRIKIVKTESLDGITTIYGHSYAFTKYIIIDSQKINVQIALNNSYITVGTPIIFGSY